MNKRNLLLLVCLLGFSSLALAELEVTYDTVDLDGNRLDGGRLLSAPKDYACTLILYTKESITAGGGLVAFLNVFGPPFTGDIDDLDKLSTKPTYLNNLHRIVYQGPQCDCTVTVHQGKNESGKSKNYHAMTDVGSSFQTKIDIDECWAKKAQSLSVVCKNKRIY